MEKASQEYKRAQSVHIIKRRTAIKAAPNTPQILRMMPPISKDGKSGASERAW
jgi:hypothetical protein